MLLSKGKNEEETRVTSALMLKIVHFVTLLQLDLNCLNLKVIIIDSCNRSLSR